MYNVQSFDQQNKEQLHMHQLPFSCCIALSFHPYHSRTQSDLSSTQSLSLWPWKHRPPMKRTGTVAFAIFGNLLPKVKSLNKVEINVDACSQDWFHDDCWPENVMLWAKWINDTDTDYKVSKGKPLSQVIVILPTLFPKFILFFLFFF